MKVKTGFLSQQKHSQSDLKLNHMQKIQLSAISLIISGFLLVGNFLLIAGCSSESTSTIEVLKEYAAESLGEDDQLVVLGGGSNTNTDYIDFRGSRSESDTGQDYIETAFFQTGKWKSLSSDQK